MFITIHLTIKGILGIPYITARYDNHLISDRLLHCPNLRGLRQLVLIGEMLEVINRITHELSTVSVDKRTQVNGITCKTL